MTVRTLSAVEESRRIALLNLGMMTRWEWMVALDVDQTTDVAFRTDQRPDGTDADSAMYNHWAGGSLIIHHNHPSDESLSGTDWKSLVDYPVAEIFAHTLDGTVFYGRLLDAGRGQIDLAQYDQAGIAAEAEIIRQAQGHPQALLGTANILRKHSVNLAYARKGWVEYDFSPGPVWKRVLGQTAVIAASEQAAFRAL